MTRRWKQLACCTYGYKKSVNAAQLLFFITILQSNYALGDIFYYNNMITGDRAMGLGGAYTGIADDSSAVIYNPAGLGYLLNDSVSGSANAYQVKKIEYQKTVGQKSFTENSEGFFAPFVGGAKKLDNLVPNLAVAFAIYSPDAEFKDQDDYLRDPQLGIESFHRTQNRRASTLYGGVAAGYRIVPALSVGVGLGFFNIDELQQSYQDVVLRLDSLGENLNEEGKKKGRIYNTQTINTRSKLVARALEPSFGIQSVLFEKFSVGINIKKGFFINQKISLNGDQTSYFHFASGQVVGKSDVVEGTCENSKVALLCSSGVRHYTAGKEYSGKNAISVSSDEPFLEGPVSIRIGVAWFASQRFLISADLDRRKAVAAKKGLGLSREEVTNANLGAEYYLTPQFPLRLGFFTNKDTRPEIKENGKTDQLDHVNYLGITSSLSWAQASGQVTGGVSLQRGKGKAQKVSQSPVVQDVVGTSYAFFFSATHDI